MGVSDQIFLFGTLFPDMVRKFWPYCGRFLLASKRNPRCVYGASLCTVVSVTDDLFVTVNRNTLFILVLKFNHYHPQSQYQVAANSNRENKADSEDESDSYSSVTVPYDDNSDMSLSELIQKDREMIKGDESSDEN